MISNKKVDSVPENAAHYDYKKIRKLYKKLGCPKGFYNPCTAPIDKAALFVEVSQRSTGKTTNWLLWGLCLFWQYGIVTHYVRRTEDEIMPKNSKGLYDVILDNGYIDKLTDGEYNSIIYRARRWFLCHINDDNVIDRTHPDYCMFMCSVDKAGTLKSSHNAPKGDFIIYDEFIPTSINYIGCDFVQFCDLCKTIFRDRLSGKIVLLANTIDRENQYFHELEIYDRISTMSIGDNALHTTDLGTNIYVEIVGTPPALKVQKQLYNKMFLGFKNTRLSGITGATTWSVRNYPHIPDIDFTVITRNIYISHNNKLINIEIVSNDLGLCIYMHWATQYYDDSIILVAHEIRNSNELYGIGSNTNLEKLIKKIATDRQIYFASNDVGSFVSNYLSQCGVALPIKNF